MTIPSRHCGRARSAPRSAPGWSQTLAPGTIGQVLRRVRRILDAAVADGLIASNPAKAVTAPPAPRRRDVHLTDEDVAAVLVAAPPPYRALVITLIGLGLRISEACGLRVQDVDFLRRTVRIRQQRRPGGDMGRLKTPSSTRDVPADDLVLEAIAEQIRRWPRTDGLVFGGSAGRPLTRSIAGHGFDDIQRAVCFAVSPHSLRHHYGAGLLSRGVSVVAVSHWLGHSSPEITYRVYAYLRPDDEAAGPAAMSQTMSQTMSKSIPDAYPMCTLDAVQGENRRSTGQSLAAVLFDMDGTLVETEQYWGDAMAALAERLGGRLSAAARERTVGTSMRFALTVLYEDVGVARDEEHLRADGCWVEERTRELMAAGAPWRAGARELVAETRASGLPTALVTTTPRRLASVVLGQLAADLGTDPFDVSVCGDEVPARKPDPAPYLQAAGALGVDIERSVVVEDSLAGVTSALAAGAVVLGVPSLQPLAPAPGLTLRSSLAGVRLADLVALAADREQDDPAA